MTLYTKIYYLCIDNIPFYIGKTTTSLSSRLYNHKKTFGNNISIKEIDIVDTNNWRFWEKYYISLFKSWGFILKNKNNGGGGISFHNKQSIDKIKINKTNHECYKNPERGKKISQTKKGKPNPKLSKSRKGKPHPKKFSCPVIQYDLQGNFIKEWEGTSIANKHYKGVHNALNNRAKTAHGYIWKYKNK